ncbi:MAG: queuosine salvage family protein, partial [Solirubrobacteraceae bacterium]
AFWLALDAINFGSGWFPTLRKRGDLSGYNTIAAGLRDHVEAAGPWSADELTGLDGARLAPILGQDPGHELMGLYAAALADLGARVRDVHGGSFAAVVDAAGGSAVHLATALGGWACFADCDRYDELRIPFLKRAQIAAADLDRAGVARWSDLGRLTMFADNLVPHVLRLDGVLEFAPGLVARIEREDLIEHGSPEEVEIRACAVHAVELIVAAGRPGLTASAVDQHLWQRGQGTRYKAVPRHRSRCTAY